MDTEKKLKDWKKPTLEEYSTDVVQSGNGAKLIEGGGTTTYKPS